jgi:protein dithiol oxidoreductase (disulfide-forming)
MITMITPMLRSVAAVSFLSLSIAACAREAPAPATPANPNATPEATAPQTPAAPPATAAAPAQAEQQATQAQETGEGTAEDRSDASLERLAQMPAAQQLPGGRWRVGVNYRPIAPAQPTNVPAGKVEVIEVFWYGCSHCYALEPYIASWTKNKPEYIEFVRVPVMWGPGHRAHAKLFYTLQALKRSDLDQKVFDTIHNNRDMLLANDDAGTRRRHLDFARANGISEADFNKAYDSFTVASNLQRAEQLTARYEVAGVPYIVIAGKYGTDVGMAGGQSGLLQLINDLAASEKRR